MIAGIGYHVNCADAGMFLKLGDCVGNHRIAAQRFQDLVLSELRPAALARRGDEDDYAGGMIYDNAPRGRYWK